MNRFKKPSLTKKHKIFITRDLVINATQAHFMKNNFLVSNDTNWPIDANQLTIRNCSGNQHGKKGKS